MGKHTTEKGGNGRGRGRPSLAAVQTPEPPVEITESGSDAFVRIATFRVNGIIAKLNTLAKMSSGKARYGYKDEDVEYMRKTLMDAVNTTCSRLRHKPSPEGFSFERRGDDAGA